jgi:hypothetical protein
MKRLVGVFILFSGLCFGQYFESSNQFFEEAQPAEVEKESIFKEMHTPSTFTFFEYEYTEPEPEPEYEVDSPGNPNQPVPINQWLIALPIAAFFSGGYYFKRKQKLCSFTQTP